MQLISKVLGGEVKAHTNSEFGTTLINFDTGSFLFKDLKKESTVFMSHDDSVTKLPSGFKSIAHSNRNPYEAIENSDKRIYCLQFHPEVRNTEEGLKIISNFLNNICKVKKEWKIDNYIDDLVNEIKKEVKDDKVILGISGGVDSSVCAALIYKAIGNNLIPIFINHGLLRENEENEVNKAFKDKRGIKVNYVDASELFLSRLKGISDPEEKRKIIGNTFIEVFKEEANKYKNVKYLAQGTIYADRVESGLGGNSKVIKSHHNVGGLPKELGFKLLEPLKSLYKDETRELGKKLGLDESFVARQPFPGPGLAIRIIGEVTKEKLEIVKRSDHILKEEIEKANLTGSIWQFFAALSNIKSVGVMGDNRTYLYSVIIRAVTSIDGMTADFYHFPYEVLSKISNRIVNEVKGINRVLYDVTSKPPSTIELE